MSFPTLKKIGCVVVLGVKMKILAFSFGKLRGVFGGELEISVESGNE